MFSMMVVLTARGYDHDAHYEAVLEGDTDQIIITHPFNWMTEEEAESRAALTWYNQNYPEAV